MTKLPQTGDLPHSAEGYERARVEEAFAEFAERVRALETVAAELRTELKTLRAERVAPARFEHESWPGAGFTPSPDWVAAVPAPISRAPAVPRLALEGAFLILVGLLAGIADLSPTRIVLVMAAAWALVALTEWVAAAKRARWHLDEIAPSLEAADATPSESTGPWDVPIVEATVIDESKSESKTVVTKLPTDQSERDTSIEAAPANTPGRSLRRWRRRPAEAGAADPWEA
jgi:hypothetical protein